MIVFATLFLGLVSGSQIVEVVVSSEVVEVELLLNGERVGTLTEEPWQTAVDFGSRLTIHELTAVGFGSDGSEVSRVSQMVNIPKQNVSTQLLLDSWHAGRPRSARLIWQSAEATDLESVNVSLDGEALEVADPHHIDLPDLDPNTIHFLVAESSFVGGQRSTAEAVFGGKFQESVPTELSAIMVTKLPKGKNAVAAAAQRLTSRSGQPLQVVAVDRGSSDVVFIRAENALHALQVLDAALLQKSRYGGAHLGKNDHLIVMSAQPHSTGSGEGSFALFPMSPRISADQRLPPALARIGLKKQPNAAEQLTNAVAVAGVRAAATKRRRAVIVLTADCSEVSGSWSPEIVRDYLEELRVPLEVWQLGGNGLSSKAGFCEDAIHVRNEDVYVRQIRRLVTDLSRQSIVWVDGNVRADSMVVAEKG